MLTLGASGGRRALRRRGRELGRKELGGGEALQRLPPYLLIGPLRFLLPLHGRRRDRRFGFCSPRGKFIRLLSFNATVWMRHCPSEGDGNHSRLIVHRKLTHRTGLCELRGGNLFAHGVDEHRYHRRGGLFADDVEHRREMDGTKDWPTENCYYENAQSDLPTSYEAPQPMDVRVDGPGEATPC